MKKTEINTLSMPIVALRGLVIFPDMRLHFDVGRKKSVTALKAAMTGNQEVFLVAQNDIIDDDPDVKGLYKTGVVAKVKQVLKLQGSDNVRVAVEGIYRAKIVGDIEMKPYLRGNVKPCGDTKIKPADAEYTEALVRHAKDIFNDYSVAAPQLPPDLILAVIAEKRPGELADFIAGNIVLDYADRQTILDNLNPVKRLEMLCVLLERESKLLQLEDDIHAHVQEQIDQNQREYYLREQLKAISGELNEGGSQESDALNYREQIEKLQLDEASSTKLLRECDRLERISPQSPESGVIRNYLETCLSLPWNKLTTDKLDLVSARKVLDKDHYGLEKVKDRIIEMLAVRKLSPDIKGQIICLVGPPGVGKTSVARSVARAMGRKYFRISLGGVHDEAEIRGHRKTYIGSMPGRIINAMQQVGTSNPLILLDEVDKLSKSYNGDPSSALLEVLDPEQNFSFRDHYIELPFDLSRVLFITTANMQDTIPAPLLDRMEIIELGSYTHEEKFNIAKNHLLPKQAKRHGLNGRTFRMTDDALHLLIDGYTKEAGVRKLEQQIAAIFRKSAVR
ncbi:MAG: endopeptidase La, partial [Clostridiales bacterium]|nr:endopeptidase La [Clostridiales bacterium]